MLNISSLLRRAGYENFIGSRKIFVILIFLQMLVATNLLAADKIYRVQSPDAQMSLEISTNSEKHLVYRVNYMNKPLLNWSDLGFRYNGISVGQGAVIEKKSQRSVKEQFAWPLGENDFIRNEFKELTMDCHVVSILGL